MRRLIEPASALLLLALVPASAETTYRLVGFDASSLPKVFGILDARSGTSGSPELVASDFRLLEDGKSTTTASRSLRFRDTGTGLALIVAIDASPSMEGRPLNAIRKGLADLVSRKRDQDRVTVLTFADDIRWETRWDATAAATQEAFRNLRSRGHGTRLYDAVGQAMDEFASQSREDIHFPPRMCILVLSDGHDEGSRASLAQIANRLRASRIRLDAVGLAHLPLWLRSLQTLANAGFGGFRTAAAPEDLSRMLGQGMDMLLDLPTIEFRADQTSRDGKSHQLGMEYLPGHWRDQVAVNVPAASWKSDWRVWTGVGLAAVLLVGALLYVRSRRTPAAPAVAAAPTAKAAPVTAFRRAETVAENSATPAPLARAARSATTVEPRSSVPASAYAPEPRAREPEAPQKPVRAKTVLAPQTHGQTAGFSLNALTGPYAGQRFPLSSDEFWIGSGTNNHLCLGADAAVSGNHACIRREQGLLRLYDNGSLNNTTVNGRPAGQDVILLRAGDRIRIGQSELSLEA
jgi:Mg-chelatase subunit ChlD